MAVYHPLDAIAESLTAKVHQQPQGLSQIRQQLLGMNGSVPFHRLHFNDERALDDQVSAECIRENHSTKCDRHRALLFDTQSVLAQSFCENDFVNRLKEPRAELPVDVEAAIDGGRSKFLNGGHGYSSRLCAFA